MHKTVLSAAVRFVAPAVLAVGTLLASSPAFAGISGEMMSKTPAPTASSRALAASAGHMRSSERYGYGRNSHAATASHAKSHAAVSTMSGAHLSARAHR